MKGPNAKVIEKARELGKAINDSQEYTRLRNAKDALAEDALLSDMFFELQAKQQKLALLFAMAGDEYAEEIVLLGEEIDRLEGALKNSPLFREIIDAQANFQSLMAEINFTLAASLGLQTRANENREHFFTLYNGYIH